MTDLSQEYVHLIFQFDWLSFLDSLRSLLRVVWILWCSNGAGVAGHRAKRRLCIVGMLLATRGRLHCTQGIPLSQTPLRNPAPVTS